MWESIASDFKQFLAQQVVNGSHRVAFVMSCGRTCERAALDRSQSEGDILVRS